MFGRAASSTKNALRDAASRLWIVLGDIRDDVRQIFGGRLGPSDAHLRPQHSLDPVHDLRVIQQCASAGVGSAFLNGFEELGVQFQQPINGFLNKSGSLLACACGKLAKAGFLIR